MFDGDSEIFYCIDLDDYHINYDTKKYVEDVETYCNDNGYKFVYFSRDVEEVFWQERISSESKIKYAARFNKTNELSNELLKRLAVETKTFKTSNLLHCLNT